MVGILLLVLWGYTNLLHGHAGGMVVPKSFRVVLGAYWVSFVLSYVIGMLRPISREEINSSDRGLLVLCSWTGLMLVAAGGLRTRASLDRLLRIIVGAGVALAVLGIVQFSTGLNPAGAIRIPGLELNSTYGGIAERSDFRRIQGTTSHPIEFGVVLVLVLPLALHYAWYAEPARRKRAWLGVVLIGVALPMAVARSAVVGLLVVMLILLAAWPSERRRKVLLCLPFFVVALKLMILAYWAPSGACSPTWPTTPAPPAGPTTTPRWGTTWPRRRCSAAARPPSSRRVTASWTTPTWAS